MHKLAVAALMTGLATLTFVSGASAQTMPSAEYREVLIKTTLSALNDANMTNNYTVFHQRLSQTFAKAHTAAAFADAFSAFRKQDIDIGAVVAYTPVEVPAPYIDDDEVLHLKGYFRTSPLAVGYDLEFISENRSDGWLLTGLNVKAKPPKELGIAPTEENGDKSSDGPGKH